jgi:hypothetical protein
VATMTDPAAIRRFVTAGRSRITLSSRRTGARYTYRVTKPQDGDGFFVSLLAGPDNEGDFVYLGMLSAGVFRLTKASKMGVVAPPVAAFRYFCERVLPDGGAVPDALEVRHEGRCGRCGRALTVPESIDTGIGPECAGKLGITRMKEDN